MAQRRDCRVKRGGLFRLQLPVSLFENETFLFDPGPPALSAHPLPCVDHSGRKTYKEGGKMHFKQICVSVRTFIRPKICWIKVQRHFKDQERYKT